MAVTRARSASQPGAGADSSTPNPGKPFGTRSPLYRCWPHRLSTSGGNDAGVLRKLGPQSQRRHRSQLFSSAGPPLLQRSLTAGVERPATTGGETPATRVPGFTAMRSEPLIKALAWRPRGPCPTRQPAVAVRSVRRVRARKNGCVFSSSSRSIQLTFGSIDPRHHLG